MTSPLHWPVHIGFILPSSHLPCLDLHLPCSVYELYTDYVNKNPFHEIDQVIKSELFDQNLLATVAAVNRRFKAAQQNQQKQ
jgi:hypothetical protein